MQIKALYRQLLSSSRNPANFDTQEFSNFLDVQENTINFQFDDSDKSNMHLCIVEVKSTPTNINLGYVSYNAIYYIFFDSFEFDDRDEALKLINDKYWSTFHVDYVNSMSKFGLPTFGFPVKPDLPQIDESKN